MIKCKRSQDCNEMIDSTAGPHTCYESPAFSNETDICGCYIYIGWQGDMCDQVSPVLIASRVFEIFLVISLSLTLILITKTIILEAILYKRKVFTADVVFLPLIFLFLHVVTDLIRFSVLLPAYYIPGYARIIDFNGNILNLFGELSTITQLNILIL